jgi:hypothetical protein
MPMAEWPDTAELAQVLDVTNVDDWQDTLDRVMAAAIAQVKSDVGHWDEYEDQPDDSLAQAALRLGELMGLRPGAAPDATDPTYQRLLKGHRRVFGIA